MIAWFTDAFEPTFMQRALLAGLLASTATAVIGTWVVLRGSRSWATRWPTASCPAWRSRCCGASAPRSAPWWRPS